MSYKRTILKEEFIIKKIVSVHYFEYAKNFIFDGEKHDFWEFLYVDKGEVEVMADTQGFKLKQGEIIFHKPNEFHNVWANGKVAPNLVVISFECNSKAMKFFENKILQIDDFEKNLLSNIIKEATNAFSSPFDDPYLTALVKRKNSLFGCEQLIKIYLIQLIIYIIRKDRSIKVENRISTIIKERSDKNISSKIVTFLNDNADQNLNFTDILNFSKLSKTNLKTLFKYETGMSVMEYFRKLKIEKAKVLIREEDLNFTEISSALGYNSIHYFSRQFKKITGMSPSEYAYSVKAKI